MGPIAFKGSDIQTDLERQFAEVYDKKVLKPILRATQEVTYECFNRLVQNSPVKTGLFRYNWQVGIDQPPSGPLVGHDLQPKGSPPSAETKAFALNKIRAFLHRLAPWHIVNNLHYARKLEEGSSLQAPAGIVAVTVEEMRVLAPEIVKRAVKAASK